MADDLAAVVDAEGDSNEGIRDGDRSEGAIGVSHEGGAESGNDGVSKGDAHDLTIVVDIEGDG